MDNDGFYTQYGLTTVEKTEPRFMYPVDPEYLWNGYIWPFATAQTLTALNRVANTSGKRQIGLLDR